LRIASEDAGTYAVLVKDMNGRLLYNESFIAGQDQLSEISFKSSFIQNLKGGMYFINIVKDGSIVSSMKFVKNQR
jgi:hypothetical protein